MINNIKTNSNQYIHNSYTANVCQRNAFVCKNDTVSFGNRTVIEKLKQNNLKNYFNELYAKSPQKCNLLLSNNAIIKYLDSNTSCFSDEFERINKEDKKPLQMQLIA